MMIAIGVGRLKIKSWLLARDQLSRSKKNEINVHERAAFLTVLVLDQTSQ